MRYGSTRRQQPGRPSSPTDASALRARERTTPATTSRPAVWERRHPRRHHRSLVSAHPRRRRADRLRRRDRAPSMNCGAGRLATPSSCSSNIRPRANGSACRPSPTAIAFVLVEAAARTDPTGGSPPRSSAPQRRRRAIAADGRRANSGATAKGIPKPSTNSAPHSSMSPLPADELTRS